jgi:hypothetical protein
MVSAKFHITGSVGDWLRIRLQEELYSHGVEGSVLTADEKTLMIIVEGENARIKRLYSDIKGFLPTEVHVGDIIFNLTKPTRTARIRGEDIPARLVPQESEYLREIERKLTQIDLKLKRIISMLERGDNNIKPTHDAGEITKEVSEETANVFAQMFGD